jgi:hypothetical protein
MPLLISILPQYQMDINIERAKDAGVAISDIFNTMQYYGGLYTTDFNKWKTIPSNDSGETGRQGKP